MKRSFFVLCLIIALLVGTGTANAKVHHYVFVITMGKWNILPDVSVKSLMINDKIPGPTIEVTEGDTVEVKVINKTPLPHTIHWHGLEVDNSGDGVPYVTQDPIEPGKSYTYRFVAKPAGTHFWHCHWSTLLHISGGMYGALIVHSKNREISINNTYKVKKDVTLILDSIDPPWQNKMLTMMENMHKKGMEEKVFNSLKEYIDAVNNGYITPYQRGYSKPEYKYHLINGHSYPMIKPIITKVGETTRIRLINAGNIPHYLHFHGMQLLIVAIDGNRLKSPYYVNTVPCFPGQTVDLIMRPSVRGWWAVHDHAEWGSTNNGHFPGGTVFLIGVADSKGFISNYTPKISLTQ
ncbi:multicopper oxidase [Thermosulfidibacter takaii ABI70S6]|uniref:Multicopper oxidase n=1 Tax=Thermosulfidibacter takaii (strain DSM 17441 / JCM 13301 / NBRC 103674 / ABI70S6) TaxID=1298851 RepID=A0A0S3QUL8_THET7|nr:multicopper oxidase domain-containing protein [Thermosulfidibacter takaii]BAT72019.1 multicopper oxidase [Thermosulfidibacter takaii ABI70S6]